MIHVTSLFTELPSETNVTLRVETLPSVSPDPLLLETLYDDLNGGTGPVRIYGPNVDCTPTRLTEW